MQSTNLLQTHVLVAIEGFPALMCIEIAELEDVESSNSIRTICMSGNVLDVTSFDGTVFASVDTLHVMGSTDRMRMTETEDIKEPWRLLEVKVPGSGNHDMTAKLRRICKAIHVPADKIAWDLLYGTRHLRKRADEPP